MESIPKMSRFILKGFGLVITGLLVFAFILWFTLDVSPVIDIEVNNKFQPVKSYEGEMLNEDSLLHLAGTNKSIPEEYKLPILLALSHFPELKEIPIKFKLTSEGAPLQSSFKISTLLLPKVKREYVILLLNEEGTFFDPIIMKNLLLDQQVAIIAHELCHTVYYHRLNTLEVIKWGMEFVLNTDFARDHEWNTDLLTIHKGFGWQLYNYTYFVRHLEGEIKDYVESEEGKWMDSFYMTDEEVKETILQLTGYYTRTESNNPN